MRIKFFQVDAFTNSVFKGNQAAVCLLTKALSEQDMQSIAMENNVAETAFVVKRKDGDFDLRWFTPAVEVPLCGHATLASAHILWQQGVLAKDASAKFHTKSGLLTAEKKDNWIEMDMPAITNEKTALPDDLLKALNVKPVNVLMADIRYLVEVETEKEVRTAQPDFRVMKKHKTLILTSRADKGSKYDIVSRYFASSFGIDEDPATGSAHCCLAPYWAKKLGKNDIMAYQASARGAELKLRLNGDRALISGMAVTVINGNFHL